MYGDPIWEKTFKERGWGQYPSEEAVRFYMKYGKPKGKPYCLDIGCGAGANAWMMAKEGARVIAMDGSKRAVDLTESTLLSFGINNFLVEVVQGDITRPGKSLKSFDIMLDNYSLYANPIDQIYEAYRQYYDLLKPGGYFLTCFFGAETSKRIFMGETTVFDHYKIDSLRNAWQINGYKVLYHEYKSETGYYDQIDEINIEKHIFCLTK